MAIDHVKNQAALMSGGTLTVPAKREPTFWNRDLAVGLAVGSFFGPVVGTLVGGVIGGLLGKSRQEREMREGREVSKPTAWNKDIVIGLGLAGLVSVVVMSAVSYATTGMGFVDAARAINVLAESGNAVPTALMNGFGSALAAGAGTTLLGGALGARHGKNRLAEEYAEAQQFVIADAQERERGTARGVAPARSYTVSPEEAQLLESRLKQGPTEGRSYVQELAKNNPSIAARVGNQQ